MSIQILQEADVKMGLEVQEVVFGRNAHEGQREGSRNRQGRDLQTELLV